VKADSVFKGIKILAVNPIDMEGRVESDAKSAGLPYEVLVGRNSDIIKQYDIVKLPRIIVVGMDGMIQFTERYVPYDKLKEEIESALKKVR
jgi:hypothetical protein